MLKDEPDIAELERERDETRLQIKAILASLKGAALEDAQDELTRLGARRNQIESVLRRSPARARRTPSPSPRLSITRSNSWKATDHGPLRVRVEPRFDHSPAVLPL
jgi:hypothetical protein